MQDLFFIAKCDHKVSNYELHIQKQEDGSYTATFPCPIIMDKRFIFIRTWEAQERYIESLTDYTDIQTIIRNTAVNAPISGIINDIGITDYEFISDREIRFTETDGVYPVDPNPELVPQNRYLVDFLANSKYCPRCLGDGVIKDLNITGKGKIAKVTGKDKIKQRVLKALITPLGMSPYDETFGSELNLLVGDVVTETTRITLQKTIVNCIDNLIQNQSSDLDVDERIRTLAGITIDHRKDVPDVLYVTVIVISELGEYIDCSIGFNLGE